MARKLRQHQKNWRWYHAGKLWRLCQFPDSRLIHGPDVWSTNFTFSLRTTFCLTETESRTKGLGKRYFIYLEMLQLFASKKRKVKKNSLQQNMFFISIYMSLHLRIKCYVSSVILTNFKSFTTSRKTKLLNRPPRLD